jgi:hypothetical protein
MSFFVDKWPIREVGALDKQYSEYKKHLDSIQSRLPSSAVEFATAAWHYDVKDHRALHDSWLESMVIRERAEGERMQKRSIEIEMRLLGAYHDGYMILTYKEVARYSFHRAIEETCLQKQVWHGDLLIDEFNLSGTGLVVHEMLFSQGARWLIEFAGFSWRWSPFQGLTTPLAVT